LDFLIVIPDHLDELLRRDAEAVEVLTAAFSLNVVRDRLERMYWDPSCVPDDGRIVKTP
jgi:hypothetical protein